jgi:hypothetical protein
MSNLFPNSSDEICCSLDWRTPSLRVYLHAALHNEDPIFFFEIGVIIYYIYIQERTLLISKEYYLFHTENGV